MSTRKGWLFGFIASCSPIALSTPAIALPLEWNLVDVVFEDGGAASGSFVYDPDVGSVGTYSNINIVTTAGTTFDGASYGNNIESAGTQRLVLLGAENQLTVWFGTGFYLKPNMGGTSEVTLREDDLIPGSPTNRRSVTGSLFSPGPETPPQDVTMVFGEPGQVLEILGFFDGNATYNVEFVYEAWTDIREGNVAPYIGDDAGGEFATVILNKILNQYGANGIGPEPSRYFGYMVPTTNLTTIVQGPSGLFDEDSGTWLPSQKSQNGGEFRAPYALFTVVPIPAAVWLFGSALGLLGWMRRKQA